MPARTPATAVNEFKDALQQALSCVSRSVFLVGPNGYRESRALERPHSLTLAEQPAKLSGPTEIALFAAHHYRVIRGDRSSLVRVESAAYYYALQDVSRDDTPPREIIAYHWHPEVLDSSGRAISYPHLHVGRGALLVHDDRGSPTPGRHALLRPDLAAAHLPTRRIAFEDVLRLAIEQFGVVSLNPNWDTALRASREFFRATRAWI